jgi:hypothetical protein
LHYNEKKQNLKGDIIMETVIEVRNELFRKIGKKRWKRILIVSLFISLVWCGVDYFVYNNLSVNYKHDIICLFLGVVGERIIPWGKSNKVAA